jgi:hypothetical protein
MWWQRRAIPKTMGSIPTKDNTADGQYRRRTILLAMVATTGIIEDDGQYRQSEILLTIVATSGNTEGDGQYR